MDSTSSASSDSASGRHAPPRKKDIRCAIYTRKSTSEGLEQEFNSLDAQREACQRYIESQRGEGWKPLPDRFDDGGFTGANTDRPALQGLFRAIRAGRVDCVVVYKVDRLSRSLLDFAKIVELFEKHEVAFVSITQQFNTTSSMGRLTLNVLLSFAQFEREIISERTRDKIAAARRKGKWVGGPPPLGYDIAPEGKRLVVNPREGHLVRHVFDLYIRHRSLLTVVREINRRGLTTKRWKTKAGREIGGRPFQLTNVQHLLANPLYTGWVVYQGERFKGEHEAVVPEDLYREAEEIRRGNRARRSDLKPGSIDAPLKGLLRCRICGCAMIHSHTRRRTMRYRYYVCGRARKQGYDACPVPSVRAQTLEQGALDCLRRTALDPGAEVLRDVRAFFEAGWEGLPSQEKNRVLRTLVQEVGFDGRTGGLDLLLNERGIRRFREELGGRC